jgi:hypothetical protein
MSDVAIHRTASLIGETDPPVSMTALRAAAAGGRHGPLLATGVLERPMAIIDKGGPLAKLR